MDPRSRTAEPARTLGEEGARGGEEDRIHPLVQDGFKDPRTDTVFYEGCLKKVLYSFLQAGQYQITKSFAVFAPGSWSPVPFPAKKGTARRGLGREGGRAG